MTHNRGTVATRPLVEQGKRSGRASASATVQKVETKVLGVVSGIRRLAIHDGPGIRTMVFLKGCPLRCLWCAAPETQSTGRDLLFYPERCLSCDRCVEVCPEGAVIFSPDGIRSIDRARCTVCGRCAEDCYAGALRIAGEEKTVEEVLGEIERDRIFYDYSGGGATLSGGEPLQQVEFTGSLLFACKQAGIHTVMETCGFQSWETFEKILIHVDLLLYDIKHMDAEKHKKHTGVSNDLILRNLKRAAESGVEIVIRVPLVHGINDDVENISAMGAFLRTLSPRIETIHLLPYHRLGEGMYPRLGRAYAIPNLPLLPGSKIEELFGILTRDGFRVQIGG